MKRITLAHGGGGTLMQHLIRDYVLKHLGGSGVEVPLEALDDAAVIDDIVLKSDSHAVKPLFFPLFLLTLLKSTKEGKDAQIIGEATKKFEEGVMETVIGGKRILAPPIGDPVPRIC